MKGFDIIGAPFNQLGCVTTDQNTVDGLRELDDKSWVGLTDWIQVRTQRWGANIVDLGDVIVTTDIKNALDSDHKDKALMDYADTLKNKVLESYHHGRIPILSVVIILLLWERYKRQWRFINSSKVRKSLLFGLMLMLILIIVWTAIYMENH